jgi:hypothetical protein
VGAVVDQRLPDPGPSQILPVPDAQPRQSVDRLFCDACERAVVAVGCSRYARYTFCPACTREYAVARSGGRQVSPGQYVRDKRFGEAETYAIPD